jgi:hypothetical protein
MKQAEEPGETSNIPLGTTITLEVIACIYMFRRSETLQSNLLS